jgi:hypothetical protein
MLRCAKAAFCSVNSDFFQYFWALGQKKCRKSLFSRIKMARGYMVVLQQYEALRGLRVA